MNDKDQRPAIANDAETPLRDESIPARERRAWSAPRLNHLPAENTLGPSTFNVGQSAHVS
jgi:hypothetical protein